MEALRMHLFGGFLLSVAESRCLWSLRGQGGRNADGWRRRRPHTRVSSPYAYP